MQKFFLIVQLLTINLAFSQTYHVFKTDGSEIVAKRYNSASKFLKVVTLDKKIVEVPYNELDRIEYDETYRKKTRKVIKEFVLTSDEYGYIMDLIHDGPCKSYTYIGPSAGHTITLYYAKMKGDRKAVRIGSKNFIDLYSYKNQVQDFFKSCPSLVQKIEEKFKRKKAHDLVSFYNLNCG